MVCPPLHSPVQQPDAAIPVSKMMTSPSAAIEESQSASTESTGIDIFTLRYKYAEILSASRIFSVMAMEVVLSNMAITAASVDFVFYR
ncbi:hypothetical protein JTB14_026550 [Gonioctena quinquepunctata]|nr:hypothetical protein JTB14_026550 [Gonioctena quinquepunctata]